MTEYKKLSVNGTGVFYREAGSLHAPVVLLLHGFPTSSHMFRRLIGRLAVRFHVIAPDLPGFGFSDAPPRESFAYTFEHLARLIGQFTEQLGLQRFALYVFDYGAPVGFRLALAHPERITALVTQNGNAYIEGLSEGWNPLQQYWLHPTEENRNALKAFLSPEATRFQYEHGASPMTHIAPETFTLDSALLARPGITELQLDLFLDYQSNVALYPEFQRYLREHLPPVLAVWGKNDPFFLPPGAEAYKRDQPLTEVHMFDTGHFALETHEHQIGPLIVEFLTRHLLKDHRAPADVVRSFYRALSVGDVKAVVQLLTPDVSWTEAEEFPYYSGTWTGPQAVIDNLLVPLARDWNNFAALATELITEGEVVVSFGRYTATNKKTGKLLNAAFAHRWTVRGSALASFQMYTDTAKVQAAMAA